MKSKNEENSENTSISSPKYPPAGHQNIPQDIPQEMREQVDPAAWDTLVPGRTKYIPLMKIRLRLEKNTPGRDNIPYSLRL